ncbi:hypothetical protein [Actinokineospora alba]|uniref:hypothetical protein n=1 Tax=Actinokineospora alba TaxID=504798 RepID=UPI000B81723D|nr:hypothetical protein [Actinokineospora alba]
MEEPFRVVQIRWLERIAMVLYVPVSAGYVANRVAGFVVESRWGVWWLGLGVVFALIILRLITDGTAVRRMRSEGRGSTGRSAAKVGTAVAWFFVLAITVITLKSVWEHASLAVALEVLGWGFIVAFGIYTVLRLADALRPASRRSR